MKVYEAEHYCILGDFNSVRSREERRGVVSREEGREDRRLFNIFLENIELIDLLFKGRKYTWMQPNGRCRVWLSKRGEVREEVISYFAKHYEEVKWKRPTLDGLNFKLLAEFELLRLEGPFSEDEVSEVIQLSDGNKSPRPDEFNFSFFNYFWRTPKREIMEFFEEFYVTAKLPCI
ncbi:hypothetical protein TSUD_152000 [Trifolium subterraneum]|uniref:Endonuclease/exonuclease/phosphatase domain-containing protein n=1 Tax=Trifolium subterraneum TaxID=3900 RepID=A0A2Z6NAP4_TRISU|nr:hypothetical protein TSUD_152000 [Trifolium subterraneum]